MKAVVYARCSTSADRQSTEVQLIELRQHCKAFGWDYDEVWEYDSGYQGEQPKLQKVLEAIRRGRYQAFLVYSLDRFSRQNPSKVNRILDAIVERDGCRFITRLEGLDSQNEMIWQAIRPIFAYFANKYSRDLSEKIRAGIRTKRLNGAYRGGRPPKLVNLDRLREILAGGDQGWRGLAKTYNEALPRREQISPTLVRRVCQKHSLRIEHREGAKT